MKKDIHITNPVEIWGGVECSVVRIEDKVHDQLEWSGHEQRLTDLELFADLGISIIRYPLLWEKFAMDPDRFFQLHNHRLEKLKELKITPIAGLLHHGSGPFDTNLLDPNFPELLGKYAAKIAAKYPWITLYTPINEPLTTARFSGLYGTWYPHKKDDASFVRIFVNEIKGIIKAMFEIRKINPAAQLIQTEDICKIHSTDQLQYQADFENHRRWLTYDFLTGKFDRNHPLWNYFVSSGIAEYELDFLKDNYVVPYIAGYNYYITSERYLDHRKSAFPLKNWGGNCFQTYADVEAIRVQGPTPAGPYNLLKESWERYHLPIALTEVHMGCTREEQLRWFHQAYKTGLKLKDDGVDFRAITAWSFFGSYDWDSLLCHNGNYESGVFDLRAGKPRPTALAALISALQKNNTCHHNLLDVPGWWQRDIRVIHYPNKESRHAPFGAYTNDDENKSASGIEPYTHIPPILVLGSNGLFNETFSHICRVRGILIKKLNCLFVASSDSIDRVMKKLEPWAIINVAGFLNTEHEIKSKKCLDNHTLELLLLEEISKNYDIRLLRVSFNQVFNEGNHNLFDLMNVVLDLLIDETFGIIKSPNSKEIAYFSKMASNMAEIDENNAIRLLSGLKLSHGIKRLPKLTLTSSFDVTAALRSG